MKMCNYDVLLIPTTGFVFFLLIVLAFNSANVKLF